MFIFYAKNSKVATLEYLLNKCNSRQCKQAQRHSPVDVIKTTLAKCTFFRFCFSCCCKYPFSFIRSFLWVLKLISKWIHFRSGFKQGSVCNLSKYFVCMGLISRNIYTKLDNIKYHWSICNYARTNHKEVLWFLWFFLFGEIPLWYQIPITL